MALDLQLTARTTPTSRSAHQSNFPRCVEASGRAAGGGAPLCTPHCSSPLLPQYIHYILYSCSKTTHMHIDKTDKIKIETAGQLYYMMCEVLSNLPKVRPCRTMCDFHNFGLIFTGQCTVFLKGCLKFFRNERP